MTLAQKLYEEGLITYMRTDSTNISSLAINSIKEFVIKEYGKEYSRPTQYASKSRGAQEAHEAVRVTHLAKQEAGKDSGQKKLYELIWRRTVASQMSAAKIEKTIVTIGMNNSPAKLVANGEVLEFDGFLKVYGGGKEDKILPPLEVNKSIKLVSMTASETFDRPQARYSEASLVKKLEELGIGRPSTYAPTISTIQDRGYIEKKDLEGEKRQITEHRLEKGKITSEKLEVVYGADRSKLIPTELADVVTDFLVKNFADIVDYSFTAKAEEELDDIADGKTTTEKMLEKFYKHFHTQIKSGEKVSRAEALQVRKLGQDPKTKKPVFVRYGRFGPVLQLGESPDPKDKEALKPQFASLPEDATLEEVTLEEALPMFKLPRIVGKTDKGDVITASIGRYGPYIKVGSTFISLKDKNPMTVSLKDALVLIKEKEKEAANRVIADYGEIKLLRGPYGPYVTDGKRNVKIPKKDKPEKISLKEAQAMLDAKKNNVVK